MAGLSVIFTDSTISIKCINTDSTISQYADDTILFLVGSEESIKGSLEELKTFGRHSGLKVNPRPDEVWRVTRPDEGVAQRAPPPYLQK